MAGALGSGNLHWLAHVLRATSLLRTLTRISSMVYAHPTNQSLIYESQLQVSTYVHVVAA
jgi:hypothetical protein